MITHRLKILTFSLCALTLASCTSNLHTERDIEARADYWQRIDTSSAIYTRGTKAQQMLNRDIARCVTEIRELKRLGAIRKAIPSDGNAAPNTPEGKLEKWETPERSGALRAEHTPFHDFEGCMYSKGWERTKYVPYDVAKKSREAYLENVYGENYQLENELQHRRNRNGTRQDDFSKLNK